MQLIVRGQPGLLEPEERESTPWEIQEDFLAKMSFWDSRIWTYDFKEAKGKKKGSPL